MKPVFTGRAFSPFKLTRTANSVPLPSLMAPAMADQDDDWSDSDDEAEGQTPEFGDKRTFNFPTE